MDLFTISRACCPNPADAKAATKSTANVAERRQSRLGTLRRELIPNRATIRAPRAPPPHARDDYPRPPENPPPGPDKGRGLAGTSGDAPASGVRRRNRRPCARLPPDCNARKSKDRTR